MTKSEKCQAFMSAIKKYICEDDMMLHFGGKVNKWYMDASDLANEFNMYENDVINLLVLLIYQNILQAYSACSSEGCNVYYGVVPEAYSVFSNLDEEKLYLQWNKLKENYDVY